MKSKIDNDDMMRNVAEDLLPVGFDAHESMRILSGYLVNLETAFDDFRKMSHTERRRLESEYRALCKTRDDQKQEIERLTTDLLEVTNTLEEHESMLSTANQKTLNYEKQFKRLHRENSELSNKLTQKENDADFYRQELERSVRENDTLSSSLQSANMRVEDLERKLAVERETSNMHEKEARRLNLVLSESQGKNVIVEKKMEDVVTKYNEEIKRLSDRASADAQHEVNLLRKRVKSSVAPEVREMDKLLNEKISIEMASNFKSLLSRLVSKLEQAGLDLK